MVAGADRLRFLGVLSRYAGLIAALELHETEERALHPREKANA